MRRLLLLFVLAGSTPALGCASVSPWERAILAERTMDPLNRPEGMREDFLGHGLDVREGGTGGRGVAGGGCGCN